MFIEWVMIFIISGSAFKDEAFIMKFPDYEMCEAVQKEMEADNKFQILVPCSEEYNA